jgi:hypothetical protein
VLPSRSQPPQRREVASKARVLRLTIPQPALLLADKVIEYRLFTAPRNVRFWHKADIAATHSNVRFWGK